MAAVWLKRRKHLARLLDPSIKSDEIEQRLPKEDSSIAAIRREVFERSQTVDDSDLEFLPKPSSAGSPATSPSAGPSSPHVGELQLSDPGSEGSTPCSRPEMLPSPCSPGNVSLSIARRRSSVNLREPLPDTEGGVIDFLERRRVVAAKTLVVRMWQRGQRGIITGEVVAPAYEELQFITQVLRPPHPWESVAISDCRFLVETEELEAAISWIVTRENKTLQGPGRWPKTSPSSFKNTVKKLVRMELDCREMERQAQAWLERFQQLYSRSPTTNSRSYSFDHRTRMVDFWYEYHKEAWDTRHVSMKRMGSAPKAKGLEFEVPELVARPQLSRSEKSLVREGTVSKLPPVKCISSRERYLKLCNGLIATPLPLPFMIGDAKNLDLGLAHLDLSDPELRAIADTLPTVDVVKKVDLHGNALLSDKAIAQLLMRLHAPKLASKLLHLSIGGCVRAGPNCVDCLIELVSDAFYLQRLDLSHVKVAHHQMLPLCEAISERTTLEYASLCGTTFGSGPSPFACQCVTTLLQGQVTELDLSWNTFDSEIFSCLGETLNRRKMVKKLTLCNCSGNGVDHLSTPINDYLETLAMDTTLTSLDLTMTRMDFRSALVLEDALQNHKTLKHLQLCDNPLGPRGLRSVLRCVATATNSVVFFDTSGFFFGEEPSIDDNEVFKMSDLQGAGSYNLQLRRSYHRSLLRMLYKAAERFKLSPAEVFTVLSEGPFTHGKKNDGIWEVPNEGEVCLSFNLERCLESSIFKGLERDFDTVIKRFFQATRHQLDEEQAVPIFGRWYDLEGSFHAQTVLLQALSNDFLLSLTDLRVLAATSQLAKPKCIINLLPSVLREPGWYYVAQGMYSTTAECVSCRMHLKQLINFSTSNPTGHYKLNLEHRADLAVAQMLRLLDKWEVLMDKKLDRPDISSLQNRSHARNVYFFGKEIETLFADWKLPSHDHLELDYSSSFGPPGDAKAISQDALEQILEVAHNPLCNPAVQVQSLKANCAMFYVTSRQLRQIIGAFQKAKHRIELCVAFFNRIVDPWNSKLFRGRLESFDDLLTFRKRIGMARTFPYIQPEFEHFHLNLHYHDERICISNLLAISTREDPGYIRNPEYTLPDGTVDPLKMGIPRSWEMLDRVPVDGTFQCSYVCSPGMRNYEHRKQLCKVYHFDDVKVQEKEVQWWTNWHEVPTEAMDLIVYLKDKKLELNKVFDTMNGSDGNGEVGMFKLQRGLEIVGWPPDERSAEEVKEMYLSVFRCVNAHGHGTILKSDWNILQQVKNDVVLCIAECLAYLLRISDKSWTTLWNKLDTMGEGSLDRQQWQDAMNAVGYFGPSDVVFRYAAKKFMTQEALRALEPLLADAK